MNDLATKLTLIGGLCLACFGAGWFAHAPAPPSVVTQIVQAQAAAAETTYVHDTLRFTQLRTRYDTTRDTVLAHLTDTVRVREYVVVADSTITACQTALGSCQRALDANHTVIQIQQAQAPSHARQFLTAALYLGVGFGVGHSLHH